MRRPGARHGTVSDRAQTVKDELDRTDLTRPDCRGETVLVGFGGPHYGQSFTKDKKDGGGESTGVTVTPRRRRTDDGSKRVRLRDRIPRGFSHSSR